MSALPFSTDVRAAPLPSNPPPPAPGQPPAPPPIIVPPPAGDPPPHELPVTDPPPPPPVGDPPRPMAALGRVHMRRLREVYRSAGWPCCDAIEVDLLAAGLLERVRSALGHETVRLSDAGVAQLAGALAGNRGAMSAHESLVEQVAREMTRGGRIAWRGLSLRARLAPLEPEGPARWCIARPDVFSIRNTTVEAYAHPVVHEVKVSRADLLGDLRRPDKRAAYLDLGGECWYVLGNDARGRPIGGPEDVPAECGVMLLEGTRLTVARAAVHRPVERLPFGVWMALAKAQPVAGFDDEAQQWLMGAEIEADPAFTR